MTTIGPMQAAVAFALKNVPDVDRESGTRALIRQYARILDASIDSDSEAKVFGDIGPKLLQALVAMGMVPASSSGGDPRGNAVPNTFNELRARRERRDRATRGDGA